MNDCKELTALCNTVDRSFLSDRLPYPYTEEHVLSTTNSSNCICIRFITDADSGFTGILQIFCNPITRRL